MSSDRNKRLKPSKDNSSVSLSQVYGKDSFERFGDDLTEVLLSYLSLEDKFRFECVSKQIQRLIFTKQTELRLKKFTKINKYLTAVFRKCPNIKSVSLSLLNVNEDKVMKALDTSEHLKRIRSYEVVTELRYIIRLQKVFTRIGPNVRILRLERFREFDPFLQSSRAQIRLCSNLETIICRSPPGNSPVKSVPIDLRYQFCLKNLKSISIQNSYNKNEVLMFKSFVEHNHHSLRSMNLVIRKSNTSFNDSKILFSELLKLRKLNTLRITSEAINNSFVNYFKQLPEVCPNLRTISFKISKDLSPLFLKLYESIDNFKELYSLNLDYGVFSGFEAFPYKLMESPKKCLNLVELSITGNLVITDEFFESMVTNLPNIQTIVCKKTFITNNAFESLSKLSNLKKIHLTSECESAPKNSPVSSSVITEPFFLNLLFKCKKLSEFQFNSNPIDFNLKVEDLKALRDGEFPTKGILLNGKVMSGKDCKKYFPKLSKATIDKYL